MKALRFVGWREPPVLTDVPTPEPGPGQVLIRVGGAGLCHSDLHVMDWPAGMLRWDLPFTLGHETAGWVEQAGPGVEGFPPGEPVIVYGPWGCGRCERCRAGMENYCDRAAEIRGGGGGLGRDGGIADFMLVPSARLLLPLEGLDPIQAAPLGDAALTPYHAIKRSLPLLSPGSSAVVVGVGGLGHMGVQILKALSPAQVIAVDLAEDKLGLAREVGADAAVLSDDRAVETIRKLTAGRGADAVIDFVGSDTTLALAAKVARVLGHLTVVGLAGGRLDWEFFALPYECQVASTYWGSVTELAEVLELARAGKIQVRTETFGLDQAMVAYERMRAGTLRGRAVVTPDAA